MVGRPEEAKTIADFVAIASLDGGTVEEVRKQCDVLCVGGGIAGLMAAIRAAELGAKVIVAEKSNTLRSGAAGAGNDHFQCYIPEVHGDFDAFWKDLFFGQLAGEIKKMNVEYLRYWFENSFNMVKLWDEWGIPMKYEGRYEFAGHSYPGKLLNHLKYSGMNQKVVLTKQALDREVELVNRVMIFDLLKGGTGGVIGAVGISTRENVLYIFEAGSVVLATGGSGRLYPAVSGSPDNNRGHPITITGDGRSMAYRAGAALQDLEMVHTHAGPKYLVRPGQATWIGVLRDRYGKEVGPFVTKPDRLYGDMTIETSKTLFSEYNSAGKGPVYMDMNGISKEDLGYMVHWLKNEGNGAILASLAEEGVDLARGAIEFQTFELGAGGGVGTNHRGETTVEGLYAAGDEVWGTISHAAVFGWSAGENAARRAQRTVESSMKDGNLSAEEEKAFVEEMRNHRDGPCWQEALSALQQIMIDYCGYTRSESLLSAGLDVIRRLKKKARSSLCAGNAHELAHCLEVLNLIDVGELVVEGAYDRRETRGLHVRTDYPLTNPLLTDKYHVVRRVEERPFFGWL